MERGRLEAAPTGHAARKAGVSGYDLRPGRPPDRDVRRAGQRLGGQRHLDPLGTLGGPELREEWLARPRAERVDHAEQRLPRKPLSMVGEKERAAARENGEGGRGAQRELAGRAAGRLDRGRVEPIEFVANSRQLLLERRRTEQAGASRRDP